MVLAAAPRREGAGAVTAWADLTSRQIAVCDRNVPVVLPVGAVEQHGPHLPLSTDMAIAEYFRQQLDDYLGDEVLTLPTIATGYSGIHGGFPGTLSVQHSTLLDELVDIGNAVLGDGFKSLVLLNANGGNEGVAQVALEQLGARWHDRRVVRTTWWRVAAEDIAEVSTTGPGGVGHACELETSLMLLIAPALVDLGAAPERENRPAFPWDRADMLRAGPATLFRRLGDVSATGVFGEPKAASLDKGRMLSEVVRAGLVALVRSLGEAGGGAALS